MIERQPRDSSRDLLEELEDGWATAPPPQTELKPKPTVAEAQAPEADGSSPDVDSLDEGWLDDLFPGDGDGDGDGDENDEDEDEESEPELPDERLDPEAFALAKKAREERAAKKKERRKAKLEAKRARQKARAAAVRQKQKGKKARPASVRATEAAPKSEVAPKRAKSPANARRPAETETDDSPDELVPAGLSAPKARPRSGAPNAVAATKRASTIASIKLLAIVLGIMLALAALAAALLK